MDIHSSNQNPLKFRLERLARWPLTQTGDKYLGLDTVAGSPAPAPVSGGTNVKCTPSRDGSHMIYFCTPLKVHSSIQHIGRNFGHFTLIYITTSSV